MDCLDQLVTARFFQDVTGSSHSQRFHRQGRVLVHRQHDDLDVDAARAQLPQHRESTEVRQRDVQEDDVRLQPRDGFEHETPIADRAGDLEVFAEETDQTVNHNLVIVDDEQSWTTHDGPTVTAAVAGTRTRTVVPCPRCVTIRTSPPIARARSSMLTSPRPLPW